MTKVGATVYLFVSTVSMVIELADVSLIDAILYSPTIRVAVSG